MQRIRELIVVEGKHDVDRLHQLYDCDTLITGGLSLNQETVDLIVKAAETRGIIILTDPDQPGEVIRRRILEAVPQAKCGFIRKADAIGKRNVGVEYASDQAIAEALDNLITFSENKESISWSEYISLGLIGDKEKRAGLCEQLHIGYCNNRTLFKRLNMLGITYNDIADKYN